MSMKWDAMHALSQEGADPDEPLSTALDIMLQDGDYEIVIDILRGMLAKQGMTGAQIDTNLEAECCGWLADQTEGWWER